LEYPNKDTDCFNPSNPYLRTALYDAGQSVSRHTIGPSNPYISENNCNNYQHNGQSTTDLNSEWASMDLIAPGANYSYPKTFVFGYLCSGPVLDGNGNDLSNNTGAQGWSYQSLLTTSSQFPQLGFPEIYRIDGCSGPEMIWGQGSVAVGTPNSGYVQSKGDMITNCRNSH
jgi:hypothetical protein